MTLAVIKIEIDKHNSYHQYMATDKIHIYLSKYLKLIPPLKPKLLIVFEPLKMA